MKPILFSTHMVQAIIDGRKTQTRRPIKPLKNKGVAGFRINFDSQGKNAYPVAIDFDERSLEGEINMKWPCEPGDILWVRETWNQYLDDRFEPCGYCYRASPETFEGLENFPDYEEQLKWRPSIHMPKAAARIFLKVTAVRAERLHDITIHDAEDEGVERTTDPIGMRGWKSYLSPNFQYLDAKQSFASLWTSINGPESWHANPWVWVYTFEKTDNPQSSIVNPKS